MLSETITNEMEQQVRRNGTRRRRAPRARGAGGWYRYAKPVLDFLLALALSVVAVPLVLVGALLVKLTTPGPAFYTQVRLGRKGRAYRLYKLRTMYHNCENDSGPRWSCPGDPRVTRVGRILRGLHLDELPQLWNVLRGDMSLVGPRPERPELIPPLEAALPCYRDRLLLRPGLTGLAQIQLPPDTDLASVRRKLACDLYYVEGFGFWLDLRILFCTGLYLLGLPLRAVQAVLRVPGHAQAEDSYRALADEETAILPHLQSA